MDDREGGFVAAVTLASIYVVGAISEFAWAVQWMMLARWRSSDWAYSAPAIFAGIFDLAVAWFLWANAAGFANPAPSGTEKRPAVSPEVLRTAFILAATLILFLNLSPVIGDLVRLATSTKSQAGVTAGQWVGFLSGLGAIAYFVNRGRGMFAQEKP